MTHEGAMYLGFSERVGKDTALEIMMASGVVPLLDECEVAMLEKMRREHEPVLWSKCGSVCVHVPPFDAGEAIERIIAARPK